MSAAAIGVVFFLIMMVMVFLGIPVFISMLTASLFGFLALSGGNPTMMLSQFTGGIYNLGANYNYAVLPLFSLVGALVGETGVAEGLFKCLESWLKRVKGGMLYTVIFANAAFGACSGSSIAGNIVFGKLSLPELRRRGYDEKLSLGCIAASGALSTLIPPSMGILMFCIIAPSPIEVAGESVAISVGTALTGGIVPGILTAIALCITVRIVGAFRKDALPPKSDEPVSWHDRIHGLAYLIPIILLFGLIIGGTMLGWFTATVAGAVGAAVVLIYALIRRLPLKRIWNCIVDSAVMEAGIFPIIIGGQLFSRFVSNSGLAAALSNGIASLNAPAFVIFILVMLLYVVCGCVMDMMSIIIITVPVVFPILCGLGYSPYAIIIALCFMMEIAGLTPPIGMNVFATSNALRVSPSKVFAGVWPFFICEVCMVLLIAFCPAIVTWLPNLIR
ncbi:MAG: TRAP transporter large permease [Oscillospiraceae bacterium]|nr:TRAP transporter large permease [Oscillospiraceae bacterium]